MIVLEGEVGSVRPDRHSFASRDDCTSTRCRRVADHGGVVDRGCVSGCVVDRVLL